MSAINTNVSSILARNALVSNERNMSTSMERLSTGLRINSSKDDAAGLAISSKMTSQIRGLDQAVRNANDAVSLIQTAEGALIETTNMLQRMREIAVQSATDTNTTDDRAALDKEFQALKSEINRIGANTQWNGSNILDKSASSNTGEYKFQVGANAAQTIDLTIGKYKTDAAVAVSSAVAEVTTVTFGAIADGDTVIFSGTTYTAANSDGANVTALVAAINADSNNAFTATGTTTDVILTAKTAGALTDVVAGDFTGTSTALGTVTKTTEGADAVTTAVTAGLLTGIVNSAILTQANADSAITALDAAIKTVNEGRAEMGATMNRLQYAADNLANVSANATESRGRILDADYAKETTELARTQIIAQAGTAMLAQANQVKQTVLSLLK